MGVAKRQAETIVWKWDNSSNQAGKISWDNSSGSPYFTWTGYHPTYKPKGFCEVVGSPGEYIWLAWLLFVVFIIIVFGVSVCCYGNAKEVVRKWHVGILALNASFWFWIFAILICKACGDSFWEHNVYTQDFFYIWCAITILLVILIIVDAVMNHEGRYLLKMKSFTEATEYLSRLRASMPYHRVHVECFHRESKVTTTGGYRRRTTTVESHKRKVVTYEESKDFKFDIVQDQTEYPDITAISNENPFISLHFEKFVGPGDTYTQEEVEIFKRKVMASNGFRDEQIEDRVEVDIPGWEDRIMATCEDESKVPWYFNAAFYYLCCIFSISIWLRLKFRMLSKPKIVTVKKVYISDPAVIKRYDFDVTGGPTVHNTMIVAPNQGMGPMQVPVQYEGEQSKYGEGHPMMMHDVRQPAYNPESGGNLIPPPAYEDATKS